MWRDLNQSPGAEAKSQELVGTHVSVKSKGEEKRWRGETELRGSTRQGWSQVTAGSE